MPVWAHPACSGTPDYCSPFRRDKLRRNDSESVDGEPGFVRVPVACHLGRFGCYRWAFECCASSSAWNSYGANPAEC